MIGGGTDVLPGDLPGGWWYRYGNVLALSLRRVTDPERWRPRYDGELILCDDSGEDQLRLTLIGITGDFSFCVGQSISGLQILDTREAGYEPEARYHIRDFEEGDIELFCRDIRVERLEGPERYQEDCPC